MADVADNTQQLDALALKAAQGDAGAYDELLDLASRRLYTLARKMFSRYPKLRRWEQTDDVFQNAMIRLHRSLAEVRPDSARAFLGLAAVQIRRTLLDLARHHFGPAGDAAKHQSDASVAALQQQVTRQERPETLAEWARFHEIIDGLPDEEREAFHLMWYDGMSQKQVAELLDMSERTVRRRVQTARLAIYEAMHGEQPPVD
jgi:RNA polymerase sigma-70 factor (ECF subfamily)